MRGQHLPLLNGLDAQCTGMNPLIAWTAQYWDWRNLVTSGCILAKHISVWDRFHSSLVCPSWLCRTLMLSRALSMSVSVPWWACSILLTPTTGVKWCHVSYIHTPSTRDQPLPYLQPHHSVVIVDTVDVHLWHPFHGGDMKFKCTQVPILPGFAITVHKSQALTLEHAVIDLEGSKGTESHYVMLSHMKSLTGLVILCLFSINWITCCQSEDVWNENKWLEIFNLFTLIQNLEGPLCCTGRVRFVGSYQQILSTIDCLFGDSHGMFTVHMQWINGFSWHRAGSCNPVQHDDPLSQCTTVMVRFL